MTLQFRPYNRERRYRCQLCLRKGPGAPCSRCNGKKIVVQRCYEIQGVEYSVVERDAEDENEQPNEFEKYVEQST